MAWFDNENAVSPEIRNNSERTQWAARALITYEAIRDVLPRAFREIERVGTFEYGPIEGMEGDYCWMLPLSNPTFGKILGTRSEVALFNHEGKLLFEGAWGDAPEELIRSYVEFFIYLKPRDAERSFDLSRVKAF